MKLNVNFMSTEQVHIFTKLKCPNRLNFHKIKNKDKSVKCVFVDFKQTLTPLSFMLQLSAFFQRI